MTISPRPLNVVLILGDYMGYGDIGPTGVPDIRTPHLDRLAAEGVLFTDTKAPAPICSPSRAGILTGRMPARIGLEENVNFARTDIGLANDEHTLSRLLKGQGYRTGLFGKWHLGASEWNDPLAHGFDEFLGFHDWSIDYHTHKMMNGQPGLFSQREPTTREGYSTDVFTAEAVAFIRANAAQPFFAFVSYNAALPPHQPPHTPGAESGARKWHDGSRQDHCAVVESLDTGVGELLATLDELDLARDTLVIFSYDHGGKEYSRRAPFFHGFASLWEGGIRVPLLLRWPGVARPGVELSASVSLLDLLPTVLAATGTKPPAGVKLDGLDLTGLLTTGTPLPERTFYWRIAFRNRHQRAIRTGAYKYLWDETAGFLFNVIKDPGERDDLTYREPDIAHGLSDELDDWVREFPDPFATDS